MQLQGKDANELKTDSYAWMTIGHTLESAKILVPQIHSVLTDHSALLIDDFGNTTLDLRIAELQDDDGKILPLYEMAAKIVCAFLKIKPDASSAWSKRAFDFKLLHSELEFFRIQHMHTFPEFHNNRDSYLFNQDINALCLFISQLPQHFVHRDFHSRNLMYVDGNLGVLDFQDARWGPAAYDLVSLCFDPYVALDAAMREKIFQAAINTIEQAHGSKIRTELEDSWPAVLLQRLLKAIGSFAYLSRKGKRDYRVYIEPALHTLRNFSGTNTQWPFLTEELIPRLIKLTDEKTT